MRRAGTRNAEMEVRRPLCRAVGTRGSGSRPWAAGSLERAGGGVPAGEAEPAGGEGLLSAAAVCSARGTRPWGRCQEG